MNILYDQLNLGQNAKGTNKNRELVPHRSGAQPGSHTSLERPIELKAEAMQCELPGCAVGLTPAHSQTSLKRQKLGHGEVNTVQELKVHTMLVPNSGSHKPLSTVNPVGQ